MAIRMKKKDCPVCKGTGKVNIKRPSASTELVWKWEGSQ